MDEKKLQQAQMLEQNLHSVLLQKQAFQLELSETKAALKELDSSGEEVYKIIGQLMLKKDKKKIKQELEGKEKILDSSLKRIEKQEKESLKELEKLQEEFAKLTKK